MDRSSVCEQSLTLHLALIACRHGSHSRLINELKHAIYLAYLLQRVGYESHPAKHFKIPECAVQSTLATT